MADATELSSLMDDAEFLSELEKLEGEAPRGSADRARRVALATGFTAARAPMPSPSTRPLADAPPVKIHDVGVDVEDVERPAIARDANRWNIHGPAIDAGDPIEADSVAPVGVVPVFLTIAIGMSAGAAGSALLFHDRLSQIISLWSR